MIATTRRVLAAALVGVVAAACGDQSSPISRPSPPPSSGSASSGDCRSSPSARHEVSTAVSTILSYDYRTLAGYPDRVRAVTTRAFYTTFSHTFESGVKPLAEDYRAVSTADVTTVSYNKGSCSHPTFVASVTQTVSNTKLSRPQVHRVTVRAQTELVDGSYLIANLQAV